MDDFELEDAARSAFESAMSFGINLDAFIRLAKQARSAEREACAKVCDEQAGEPECPERAKYCADAIRARSNAAADPR